MSSFTDMVDYSGTLIPYGIVDYSEFLDAYGTLEHAISYTPESAKPLHADMGFGLNPALCHAYAILNRALCDLYLSNSVPWLAVFCLLHARDYIGGQIALELLSAALNGHGDITEMSGLGDM